MAPTTFFQPARYRSLTWLPIPLLLARYGLAVVAVVGALGLRLALERSFGHGLPTYITFYPAIMLVALFGGFAPGLLATAATVVITAIWILPPVGQFAIESAADRLGLVIFTGMGVFVSAVAELYGRSGEKVAAFSRETALRESQARLATFAQATFEGIFESEAGRIVDCNEQLARMLGYQVEELKGVEVASLFAPEDRDRVMANLQQGQESVIEHAMLRKNGTRIVVETHGRPVSPGSTVHHTAVRDITERKRAEEALLESRERLNLALASSRIAVFDWDIVNDKRSWDASVHLLLGTKPETFSGSAEEFLRIVHPEDRNAVQSALARAVESTGLYATEYRAVWPDGTIRHIVSRGKVHHDATGRAVRMTGVCWDVTEDREKEIELQRLNRTLKALRNSSRAMARATQESEYLQEVCQIVVQDCGHALVWIGYAEEDAGKSVRPVAHAGFSDGYLETLQLTWADTERGRGPTGTAIRTGKPSICRHMLTDPAFGPWREQAIRHGFASSLVLPLLSDGRAFGAINLYSNKPDPFSVEEVSLMGQLADDLAHGITTLRVRQAFLESERREHERAEELAVLFESVPMPVFIARDPDCLHLGGNRLAEELLRIPHGGELSLSGPSETRPQHFRALKDGRELRLDELPTQRAAQGEHVKEFEFTLAFDDGVVRHVLGYGSPLLDDEGRPRGAVSVLVDLTERKRAEETLRLLSEAVESAANGIAVTDRQGRILWINPAFTRLTGYTAAEVLGQNPRVLKSGQHPPAFYRELWGTILRGEVWHHELINKRKDGSLYSEEMTITPVRVAGGDISHFIAIKQDVTARRRAEEEVLDSLHEKEVMLKEIHHRVKNNLQVISSLVDLQADALRDPGLRGVFGEMRDRVRSMAMVHEKLYQSESLARVEFADYVRSLINYLARAQRGTETRIELKQDLQPVWLPVETAVPCGLILNELITNAFKHAFHGRNTGVITASLRMDPEGRVCLQVSDDGVGLPAVTDWRQSRSLGLRLIHLLAGQLNATVTVCTDHGTDFQIGLPQSRVGCGEQFQR